jgi:phosphocarrier protein FPr
MIGLVLVSHSQKLAEGVRDLAAQMTQGRVPIAVAGGLDDEQYPIGTDPIRVMNAITEVYHPDGVVILMDLGSALMSAETALDLLEPDWRPQLHLCAAPFVEGAVTAAVQAGLGGSAASVMAAAQGALLAKQQHLGTPVESVTAEESVAAPAASAHRLTITIPNKLGIHARPAARLVSLAGQHPARLTLRKGDRTADGRNINQVMLLDARRGDALEFTAEGDGAAALLKDLHALAEANFGDEDSPTPEPTASIAAIPSSVLAGVAASGGIAIGRVRLLTDQAPVIDATLKRPLAEEQAYFRVGLSRAVESLQALIHQTHGKANGSQAAIFEAHLLIAQDADLLTATEQAIAGERSAAAAWWSAVESMAGRYRQSDSAYLQGRAADVLDVGRRVLGELSPGSARHLSLTEPCILAAPDLAPSETAQLDPQYVLALLTEYGGATSHTAIIARGMGIPAVVGLGAGFTQLTTGQQVVVDGGRGWVYPQPTAQQLTDFQAALDRDRAERLRLQQSNQALAVTRDGRRVEIGANVGGPADSARLLEMGAEGVGLFRTELLFMGRPTAPDEDSQYEAYCAVAQALGGRPVIIRTLDVGGDKAIAYIHIPPEENPFLGFRGIRYWLDDRPLARAQMRAIYRASAQHNLRVMFPMVGALDEVEVIHAFLHEIRQELDADGLAYNPRMQIGVMVEVPSAVMCAAQLAAQVDFFSIGTNDLTQYLMAADRGNARVTPLATPFQPALLTAVSQIVKAAHAQGRWVGICGEAGGNPLLTPVWIGLGVDELSMGAPAIPAVKRIVQQSSYAECQQLAEAVLQLPTARQIEDHLRARAASIGYNP